MIHINGLDHINLEVPNIDSAKKFYQNYFGFQVKEDYKYTSNGKEIRFLLIGISDKLMLCLYENEEIDLNSMPLNHIGINVSNFDEAYEIAKKNDILDKRYDKIQYDNSRSFYINDPNGLGIEISEVFTGGH